MSDMETLLRGKPEADIARIKAAYEYATRMHADQKRLSGEPYVTHVVAVAVMLNEMKLDTTSLVAGLLHDTLEDTSATAQDIEKHFGKDVLFLVKAVTKIKELEERGTQETSYKTLMRMIFAMAEDVRVIFIKIADRIHNLRTLQYLPPEKRRRKALESIKIYAPIAERLNMGDMKGRIEDLAFPHAYPKEYAELLEQSSRYYKERVVYAERVKPKIIKYLYDYGVRDSIVDYRVKRYFSLFEKLKRYEENFELIYDLVAFRIVVPDIARCYEVLGILHQQYRPLPKRVKDYIAMPKPNGYQSLHTTVFCEEGAIVEFQIRTKEMHAHAESGIAAHWAYGESGKRNIKAETAELEWVNKLKRWKELIADHREFFEALKLDMFRNRIFVFTPKGDIKDLPEGSTPVDFAYAIHSDIGNHCAGSKINGKMISLDHQLQNNDVCEILVSKKQKPSRGWLDSVKTIEAARRIKHVLGLVKKSRA